jgi:ribonuclease VapC
LIVVDTSALVAIAAWESDRSLYQAALRGADAAYLAPINYVELGIVLARLRVIADEGDLDAWLSTLGVTQYPDVDLRHGALRAYLRYGKGRGPARLNLGDCFAYALAKQLDAPLLYKGDDFALTDIRSALQPT